MEIHNKQNKKVWTSADDMVITKEAFEVSKEAMIPVAQVVQLLIDKGYTFKQARDIIENICLEGLSINAIFGENNYIKHAEEYQSYTTNSEE